MRLWDIFVFICLLEGAKQVTAKGHHQTEELRDLTFECEEGWSIYKANCYKYEDYPLVLEQASYACMRQGGYLLYPDNELEYWDFISQHWPQKIWFGAVNVTNPPEFNFDDTPVLFGSDTPLDTIPGWGYGEPNYSDHVGIAVSAEERITIADSNQPLPFLCKHRACLQGFRSCDLASKCIKDSQICDGKPDCEDGFDENDCSEYGKTYIKTSDTNGNIEFTVTSGNSDRTYIIEVPIGLRIRLFIPSLNLPQNVAYLDIRTGSPTPQYAEEIERITGEESSHFVYSMNNFIIVSYSAQDITTQRRTVRIPWTTAINEIPSTPTQLEAANDIQILAFPFSEEPFPPAHLVLDWIITAEKGKYITYYLEVPVSTEEAEFSISIDDQQIEYRDYYVSSTNEIKVRSHFVPKNGVVKLKYRIGCDMETSAAYGYVISPRPFIPNGLTCTWTFDCGEKIGRGMTVNFVETDLREDARSNSMDGFEIERFDGSAPVTEVTDDDVIYAPSGKVSVTFTSDLVLQSGPFVFQFGTDCESLNLSDETIMSTNLTGFEHSVDLSCPEGYVFDLEKYKTYSTVTIECESDGWTVEDKTTCIPECQIVYCGTPESIPNGGVVYTSGVTYNSIATYSCNPGFILENDAENATCSANGVWINTPVCSSSACEVIPNNIIEDGSFEIIAGLDFTDTSAEFNTVVRFLCDDGFELYGPDISHCSSTGWTHVNNIPTCERLSCPVYPVQHAVINTEDDSVLFQAQVTVTCEEGYDNEILGSTWVMECQANQTFGDKDGQLCKDINECERTAPCDNMSTYCDNFDGDYSCECLEGYEDDNTETSCQDIDDCLNENGGCSDECSNDVFPYECRCTTTPGYVLYERDGFQGYALGSDTGLMRGDMYHINHTCVPLLCPALEAVDNGLYLTKDLQNFHVADVVTLHCNDGFHVSDMDEDVTRVELTCDSTGGWTQLYSCIARTCTLANGTEVTFGTFVELDCTLPYQRSVRYSAECVYEDGFMTIIGENIDVCPEIDCGNPIDSPVWPTGGNYLDENAPSSTLVGSGFEFTCDPGFDLSGASGDMNNTVTCTEDGYWNMGTLACYGKLCSDPGTPAGAVQVAAQYEVGSVLYYTCTDPGFMITGDANYTCDYDQDADSVSWSNDLADNLPMCVDVEQPVFTGGCNITKTYDAMERVSLDLPLVTDNFAIMSWSASDFIRDNDYIISNRSITWKAFDFNGNYDTCTVDFNVIDRTIKPVLDCPDVETIMVNNDTMSTVDLTQFITVSGGDALVQPSTVNYNHHNIGSATTVSVIATNGYGTESYCSFMVHFVADDCFKEELFIDDNAVRACSDSVDGLTCESTCNEGYLYVDGTQSKNFTCTGSGDWSAGDTKPNDKYCQAVQYPILSVGMNIKYIYSSFVTFCGNNEFETKVDDSLATFKSRISILCEGMTWNVDVVAATRSNVPTIFDLELLLTSEDTGDATPINPTECLDKISDINNGVFNIIENQLTCSSSAALFPDSVNLIEAPILTCSNEAFYQIDRSSDGNRVCVSIGPGEYYDHGDSRQYLECPEGTYQDKLGQSSCNPCTGTQYPNAQKTACLETCPPGFTSEDGFYPCSPCPVDTFWTNKTTCESCPPNWSTVGHDAVDSNQSCYEPCPLGCWSLSGYHDTGCGLCPLNFYQDETGQTECIRCPANSTTADDQSISINNCTVIGCNSTYCSDHGECVYNNRLECDCEMGYYGSNCQSMFHICDGNPCQNDGNCIPGSGNMDYHCECSTEYDECIMTVINTTHVGNNIEDKLIAQEFDLSEEECNNLCLESSKCVEASFSVIGSNTLCSLYNDTLAENEVNDIVNAGIESGLRSSKECVIGFSGDNCELDIKNECDTAGCHADSECKDMIDAFQCICPASGGYSGELCLATSDPCNPNPCSNGDCTRWETVSYTCECDEGYTGYNCDADIDHCEQHPNICGYSGTCVDQLPGRTPPFICECPAGFGGDFCQKTPNFCDENECNGDNVCFNSLDEMNGACACDTQYYSSVYKCTMSYEQNTTSVDINMNAIDNIQPSTLQECEYSCQYNTECIVAVFTDLFNGLCTLFNATLTAMTSDVSTAIYKDCDNHRPLAYTCERSSLPCDMIGCNNGTCMNTNNDMSFECACQDGFEGEMCQHNIDDCVNNPCQNGGTCTDEHLGFTCACTAGFNGTTCDFDIDFCPGQCNMTNGRCMELENGYKCVCNAGFTGGQCERELDECFSLPCQHGGVCEDEVNDYTCECPSGWTGDDCEIVEDKCASITCKNGGQCYTIDGQAFCRCVGGALGDFCENAAAMCDIMAGIDSCINDGKCKNQDGTAVCQCPITHNVSRCYFDEGMKGWYGDNSQAAKYFNDLDVELCLEECMELESCVAVAHTVISSASLCTIYETDDLVEVEDDASILFYRMCPIDYVGPSCELVKDWCADNPCMNDGKCECMEPIGYQCLCEPGFYGVNCQHVMDPCSTNPCKNLAKCQSRPTDHICQCDRGVTWTGDNCKEMDDRFSFLINSYNNQATPYLNTPYMLHTNELSVMMSFRIHDFKPENGDRSLLTILGTSDLRPMWSANGGNDFYLAITDYGIVVAFDDEIVADISFEEDFTKVTDGTWKQLGVSINPDGYMTATLDAVSLQEPEYIGRNFSLNYNAQNFLGYGFIAEIENVMVFDTLLTSGDFVRATNNQYPTIAPAQGWWNYFKTHATTVLREKLTGTLVGDLNSMSPQLNCSAFEDIYFVSTERVTSLGDITDFEDLYNTVKDSVDNVDVAHTVPEALSNDYYPMVVIATDRTSMLYRECRNYLFVRYNGECPTLDAHESLTTPTCSNGAGACGIHCQELDLVIPASLPNVIQCGSLGVWVPPHPHASIPLPSCVVPEQAEYRLTVTMEHEFAIPCLTILEPSVISQMETQAHEQFVDLNAKWPNICSDNGNGRCDNIELMMPVCVGIDNPRRFSLEFTLTSPSMTISDVDGSSMSISEAMEIIVLLEKDFNLDNFGEASLLMETFFVVTDVVCPPGHALIEESICAPCSAGWFFDDETRMCKACDHGSYQSGKGQTMCEECADGFTTYAPGATSDAQCKEECLKGTKYEADEDRCVACPRHYFQDEDGKNFCHACMIGYKTVLNGSDSKQDCKADCPAGRARDAETAECIPCKQGFWRSLNFDDCEPCPDGKTTFENELGVNEDSCSMDICFLGSFFNMTTRHCEECAVGFFQDELYQLSCKACSGNRTTQQPGSFNGTTDCLFYCPSGYTAGDEAEEEMCYPCPRGSYKDNEIDMFGLCMQCFNDRTTNMMAAMSADYCDIPECVQGQYILDDQCENCELDSYSDVMLPDISTACSPCHDSFGTQQTGSNSSQCQYFCPDGEYLVENRCSLCPKGTYKDSDGRFDESCTICSNDLTTEDEGSTTGSECSIPKCEPGSVIVDGSCSECPLNTYSEIDEPTSDDECIPCNECDLCIDYGTENEGTNNRSLCFATCPGGLYYSVDNDTCEHCEVGSYKADDERFRTNCTACPEGFITEQIGSTDEAECSIRNCPPGTKMVGDPVECEDCPTGTFQNESRQDFCYPCGPNRNTIGEGKTSSSDCSVFCGPGFHGTDKCEECEDGYFKSTEGFDACTECAIDTTSNAEHTECNVVYCHYGKEYNADDDVCEPCDLGFFKDVQGNDDACTPCEAGTTTDGTGQDSCTLPFCIAGQYLDNDECVPCLKGTFKSDAGNEACTVCSGDYTTAGEGSTSSLDCEIVICPAGQYREPSQISLCSDCELNSYQPETGQTSCVLCGDGEITMDDQQSSEDACVPECGPGSSFNDTTKTCELCPPGSYKPTTGNIDTCTACPQDKTTVGRGKTQISDCSQDLCQPGTYYAVRGNVASCDECEQGSYTDESNMQSCKTCPDGETTRYPHSSSLDHCIDDCELGHGFSTVAGECLICPAGEYNDKDGKNPTRCKRCPAGTTNTASGDDTCEFEDDDPRVEDAVNVFISLVFEIQIDGCDFMDAININIEQIDVLIRNLFVEMTNSRFNGDLTFCTDGCANIMSIFNTCDVDAQGSHLITLDVLFQQISDFVADTSDNDANLSTLEVIAEILTLRSYALIDLPRGITFIDFTGAKYIDVCQPGQERVNDACVDCQAGYYGVNSVDCVACAMDTYQSEVGQTSCESCPDNTFTESTNSTSLADCIEICDAGRYFDAGTKQCIDCPVGEYKTQPGNDAPCVACPAGTTSTTFASTSEDDCSENVCGAGEYFERVDNVVECIECAKGFYNDLEMAAQCKSCGPGLSTLFSKSTKQSLCVAPCSLGQKRVFPSKSCQNCAVGFYNDRTGDNPEMCKKCPDGSYTLQSGQSSCSQDLSGTSAPIRFISIKIRVSYSVAIDACSDSVALARVRSAISIKIRTILWSRSQVYTSSRSFCTDECINVSINFSLDTNIVKKCKSKSSNKRRKRALTHDVSMDVVIDSVPETVNDGIEDLPTDDVISGILATDEPSVDADIVYDDSDAPIVTPVCGSGSQVSQTNTDSCELCPFGYYSDDDTACQSCSTDTYQNETGQVSCKQCPPLTFNDDLAATTSGACRGYCQSNPLYCNSRGTCTETGRRSASCSCNTDYEGRLCENVAEKQSSLDVILGAAIGGGGGLLVIILIIIGCWRYMSDQDKNKSKRHMNDPEYSYGIYDNAGLYPQQKPVLAPYRSVGYPALGYRPDTSFEAGSQLDPYRQAERPSVHGGDEQDDQPQYVWRA